MLPACNDFFWDMLHKKYTFFHPSKQNQNLIQKDNTLLWILLITFPDSYVVFLLSADWSHDPMIMIFWRRILESRARSDTDARMLTCLHVLSHQTIEDNIWTSQHLCTSLHLRPSSALRTKSSTLQYSFARESCLVTQGVQHWCIRPIQGCLWPEHTCPTRPCRSCWPDNKKLISDTCKHNAYTGSCRNWHRNNCLKLVKNPTLAKPGMHNERILNCWSATQFDSIIKHNIQKFEKKWQVNLARAQLLVPYDCAFIKPGERCSLTQEKKNTYGVTRPRSLTLTSMMVPFCSQ